MDGSDSGGDKGRGSDREAESRRGMAILQQESLCRLEKETADKLDKLRAPGQSHTAICCQSGGVSILAVCGLLWGFTSLLHETSNQAEARELTGMCIR